MASNLAGIPIYIETNGFLLRCLTANDVNDDFLQWINSKEMMEGLNLLPINFTKETLQQFISKFDHHHNFFIGIFDTTANNKLVGFYTIDVNHTHKVGSITGGIGEKNYSGKAVFWAVIDALLDHFYLYRGLYKMVSRILASNKSMLFCFINNPRFGLEAVLQEECLMYGGDRVDIIIFSSLHPNSKHKVDHGHFV